MIDNNKHYSISEVSKITGYENHVLRYYEKEFELDIPRNEANHRYYTYNEIENLNYIKSLQEKGFTNKQIKLIINSPEVLIDEQENEIAVSSYCNNNELANNTIQQLSDHIRNIIINELQPILNKNENKNIKLINEIKNELDEVKNEIKNKDKDILICENAKLKMKIKEKTYEIVELKEKLKREKESNSNFFKKIFKK